MSSPSHVATPRAKGSKAVKLALIDAAAALLGEVGPRRISVRDIADRAGVNHGQVHHYFGGKRPLLEAAMTHLARGHFENARALSKDSSFPPPLSLAEDAGYWRAVCQVVIDGDLDLARIEIDKGISVPRQALRTLQSMQKGDVDDLALKAEFAALAAMQLGWVAFEDFMLLIADVDESDRDALRSEVKKMIARAMENALGRAQEESSKATDEA